MNIVNSFLTIFLYPFIKKDQIKAYNYEIIRKSGSDQEVIHEVILKIIKKSS